MAMPSAPLPWHGAGLEWAAFPLRDGVADLFIARIRDPWGLPPARQADRIRALFRRAHAARPTAALWVAVEVPGTWFRREIARGLWGLPAPVAVTDGAPPKLEAFSFPPRTFPALSPPPALVSPEMDAAPEAVRILLALARLRWGFTAEIAAQTGMSPDAVRERLRALARAGWVAREPGPPHPFWRLRRPGLSTALRLLGLPPGVRFFDSREKGGGGRHRRAARLWPAWVRKALGATVWAGWSETALTPTLRPDGIAWGEWRGMEALFLVEVESGHRSREELRRQVARRMAEAAERLRGYPVVLAVLGPPWVLGAVAAAGMRAPPGVSLVLGDWKRFGELPEPVFGAVSR